jgi:hypothetical protein
MRRYLLLLVIFGLITKDMPGQCVVNTNMPPPLMSGGIPVAYPVSAFIGYIMPSVETDVWEGIDAGILSWGPPSDSNGSYITLFETDVFPTNDSPVYPENCSYPNCPYVLQTAQDISSVAAEDMDGNSGITTCSWGNFGSGGSNENVTWRCMYGFTSLSDAITNTNYAAFVMAHEFGHMLALDDCPQFTLGSTIMSTLQYAME